jgi:hypothetical protein
VGGRGVVRSVSGSRGDPEGGGGGETSSSTSRGGKRGSCLQSPGTSHQGHSDSHSGRSDSRSRSRSRRRTGGGLLRDRGIRRPQRTRRGKGRRKEKARKVEEEGPTDMGPVRGDSRVAQRSTALAPGRVIAPSSSPRTPPCPRPRPRHLIHIPTVHWQMSRREYSGSQLDSRDHSSGSRLDSGSLRRISTRLVARSTRIVLRPHAASCNRNLAQLALMSVHICMG